ncbi:hypothetical protein M758_UG103000 [Ceratodon purpureus]|nr:hypothetical protein M758_UG103000 [Ceratodon purpureus]
MEGSSEFSNSFLLVLLIDFQLPLLALLHSQFSPQDDWSPCTLNFLGAHTLKLSSTSTNTLAGRLQCYTETTDSHTLLAALLRKDADSLRVFSHPFHI